MGKRDKAFLSHLTAVFAGSSLCYSTPLTAGVTWCARKNLIQLSSRTVYVEEDEEKKLKKHKKHHLTPAFDARYNGDVFHGVRALVRVNS